MNSNSRQFYDERITIFIKKERNIQKRKTDVDKKRSNVIYKTTVLQGVESIS